MINYFPHRDKLLELISEKSMPKEIQECLKAIARESYSKWIQSVSDIYEDKLDRDKKIESLANLLDEYIQYTETMIMNAPVAEAQGAIIFSKDLSSNISTRWELARLVRGSILNEFALKVIHPAIVPDISLDKISIEQCHYRTTTRGSEGQNEINLESIHYLMENKANPEAKRFAIGTRSSLDADTALMEGVLIKKTKEEHNICAFLFLLDDNEMKWEGGANQGGNCYFFEEIGLSDNNALIFNIRNESQEQINDIGKEIRHAVSVRPEVIKNFAKEITKHFWA